MKKIRAGLIKRIHVSQVNIRANRKDGMERPTFTIQTSKGPIKAHWVDIKGKSKLIHSAKPLKCGARVWLETRGLVQYE